MLGEEFRKLRQKEKISMTEACKGITSQSSLQRWETGNGLMPIEKVSKLLSRIHIQPKEYVDDLKISRLDIYTQDVEEAYAKNDLQELKKIAVSFLKRYYKKKNDVQLLFQTAIACNFYFDLSSINFFPDEGKIRIKSYFNNINEWTAENVLLFANVQYLLSISDVYILSRSLLSYLIEQPNTNRFYVMSIDTILNAIFVLIKRRDADRAYQLLKQIKELQLPEKYASEIIRMRFMQTLIEYINNNDSLAFQELAQNLNSLGFNKQAKDFEFAFNQIKKIY